MMRITMARHMLSLARAALAVVFLASLSVLAQENGSLIKGSGPRVYLVENGVRCHIPNQDTFRAMGFRWENVRVLADSEIQRITLGEPLPHADTQTTAARRQSNEAAPSSESWRTTVSPLVGTASVNQTHADDIDSPIVSKTLGATIDDVEEKDKSLLNLPGSHGAIVRSATIAELLPNDVVVALDGKTVRDARALAAAIDAATNSSATLTILRVPPTGMLRPDRLEIIVFLQRNLPAKIRWKVFVPGATYRAVPTPQGAVRLLLNPQDYNGRRDAPKEESYLALDGDDPAPDVVFITEEGTRKYGPWVMYGATLHMIEGSTGKHVPLRIPREFLGTVLAETELKERLAYFNVAGVRTEVDRKGLEYAKATGRDFTAATYLRLFILERANVRHFLLCWNDRSALFRQSFATPLWNVTLPIDWPHAKTRILSSKWMEFDLGKERYAMDFETGALVARYIDPAQMPMELRSEGDWKRIGHIEWNLAENRVRGSSRFETAAGKKDSSPRYVTNVDLTPAGRSSAELRFHASKSVVHSETVTRAVTGDLQDPPALSTYYVVESGNVDVVLVRYHLNGGTVIALYEIAQGRAVSAPTVIAPSLREPSKTRGDDDVNLAAATGAAALIGCFFTGCLKDEKPTPRAAAPSNFASGSIEIEGVSLDWCGSKCAVSVRFEPLDELARRDGEFTVTVTVLANLLGGHKGSASTEAVITGSRWRVSAVGCNLDWIARHHGTVFFDVGLSTSCGSR